MIAHALVYDRITTSLANNQIGPLHDDDRHEKGRVAGVFQLLAGIVGLQSKQKQKGRKEEELTCQRVTSLQTSQSITVNLPIPVRKSLGDR